MSEQQRTVTNKHINAQKMLSDGAAKDPIHQLFVVVAMRPQRKIIGSLAQVREVGDDRRRDQTERAEVVPGLAERQLTKHMRHRWLLLPRLGKRVVWEHARAVCRLVGVPAAPAMYATQYMSLSIVEGSRCLSYMAADQSEESDVSRGTWRSNGSLSATDGPASILAT
jgi:hypothetical protein